MLHLFVYLCFQLIKPIFIEIFFFVNRFNHVEAQEPVTLFCFILDIYKSNQRMKHTIRFLLARRFLCHNKPNINIFVRHFPFKGTLSPEKTLTNCIRIPTIDRYRYFIPKC